MPGPGAASSATACAAARPDAARPGGSRVSCRRRWAAAGRVAEGQRVLARRQRPRIPVDPELGAGVLDVEVAHRQLPDAVERSERRVAALHRQPLGLVGEVRALGRHDGVVVAPSQPQHHLTGDRRADPALQRLAEHEALRIEPAALVQQPAQAATHRAVVLHGRLVVDRRGQPLVGDVQQGQAGPLVDAAALGLDDAVLDLVAHAETVAAADRVGRLDQLHLVGELLAVERDGPAGLEPDGHLLGLDGHAGVPVPDAHDRLDEVHAVVEAARGAWPRGWRPRCWRRWSRPSRRCRGTAGPARPATRSSRPARRAARRTAGRATACRCADRG